MRDHVDGYGFEVLLKPALTLKADSKLRSTPGEETLIAVPDTTKLFERTREAACDLRPRLIVLDNSADVFGGNENDRAQVRQFIGHLRGIAIASSAGVLLTSHPSLTGINTGTGLSGSTAWNASVRSRLYFKRSTTEKDEEPDPDLRVLEVMKANYGPIGETITLRWTDGLFLPVGDASHLEKAAAEQAAEHLFLDLLGRFARQGRMCQIKPMRLIMPRPNLRVITSCSCLCALSRRSRLSRRSDIAIFSNRCATTVSMFLNFLAAYRDCNCVEVAANSKLTTGTGY
jgi:AAA domain-containing protein